MKSIVALFFGAAMWLAAANQTGIFTGVITDTMCGQDHKMMNINPDSKCVRDCVKSSKQYKYALHEGKNMYVLSDQQTPEKHAGQKVKITGTLYEKTKILKVDKIEPAK